MKRLASYSQYFLRNPRFIAGLIGRTSISRDDTVIDIGAGSGIISSQLAAVAGKVIAVEHESRIAKTLRGNMEKFTNVEVRQADILSMELPKSPYKVFANIPFHLSSPIVRRLVESHEPPQSIYLIVQKQFANKLLPDHSGFTGQLGMQLGPLYDVKILKRLRRTDYWPHPNVDTVLIAMERRGETLIPQSSMQQYRDVVERCFSTPAFFSKMPKKTAGIAAEAKPSELVLDDWIRLFRALNK